MASGNLHFRLATPDDAQPIQQLIQAAFRAVDSREGWTVNVELASGFHIDVGEVMAGISSLDSATLVAIDDNGALVGSVSMTKRSTDLARLYMLAVDQSQQRGGIGRDVLAQAQQYCQQTWGVTRLGLNALSTRHALISWYMRCGYQKTGETSPFPREKFDNLVLPEDMCFVELEKTLDPIATGEGPGTKRGCS